MQIVSITHAGLVREKNEDRFYTKRVGGDAAVLAIADGMGGHAAGEVAAQLAIDSLADIDAGVENMRRELAQRLRHAHERILESSYKHPELRGMGTTLSAVFLSPAAAIWAHVGDTRIYLFRSGSLTQITEDHTIPWKLFRAGSISREQSRVHPFRNVLLQCLGGERFSPDIGDFDLMIGDIIMLSSDGLHDLLTEDRIRTILAEDTPMEDKLRVMALECLEAGGTDNITAILAEPVSKRAPGAEVDKAAE